MKRQIIEISEELCDGCGLCVPECHEGALQIIDGKARLISDLFCDGLGACIGHCPQGAIKVVEKEAAPYDEIKVLEEMVTKPRSVLEAHLKHLLDHQAYEYLDEAIKFLEMKGIKYSLNHNFENISNKSEVKNPKNGCPGSMTMTFENIKNEVEVPDIPSELQQWPIQLHLVNQNAPYFKNKELVIMSTCGPLANANVHKNYLKGRSIVVACPKLDYTATYTDKLSEIFKVANTTKAIVVIMQVPCCSGLAKFALDAREKSGRFDMPVEVHILALTGNLLQIKKL